MSEREALSHFIALEGIDLIHTEAMSNSSSAVFTALLPSSPALLSCVISSEDPEKGHLNTADAFFMVSLYEVG